MGLSKEKGRLLERLRSPRLRGKAGAFLVEGVRGVGEFLRPTLPLRQRFVLTSPRLGDLRGGGELRAMVESSGIPHEEIGDDELRRASATENAQGVIMVVEEPPPQPRGEVETGTHRVLLLDGIQDPGNVGTLVRCARAFGLDAVIALDGTADPWGPKAVRASAGALAHTPLFTMKWQDALGWMVGWGIPIVAASADGEIVPRGGLPGGWALVLGNEGAGIRAEARKSATRSVAIPMAPGVDSLNVAAAGAVLLYALSGPEREMGED